MNEATIRCSVSPEYPVERTLKVPFVGPPDCSIMLPTGSLVLQTLRPVAGISSSA